MPKIRFLQDRSTVEAAPQHFKAGQVYELNDASCERWVRRGVAEHVVAAARSPKQAKPVTASPEPQADQATAGQTPSSQLDLADGATQD